jgi:NAD(P)-dependent dehydrogenase (short-subunit alcohol dehydrogenase family)
MNNCLIITGAKGLIGKELVDYFKSDYFIISVDLIEYLESFSDNIYYIQGDISEISTWLHIKEFIREKNFFISGVLNCGAITNSSRSNSNDPLISFMETMKVNVASQFLSIEVLLEVFLEQNYGRIVNFGSLYSVVSPTPRLYENSTVLQTPAYTASKHAVVGLTKFYASRLIKNNITVNMISPGGVFDYQDSFFLDKYNEQNPSGRMANPSDFFPIINSILSVENNYMTGQNILVDGGWTSI